MQKKIGITIALTMLIVLMAGMTFLPTTVSAAGDINTKGCAHTSLALCTPGNPWYPHADEYGHEKRVINEYYCTECYSITIICSRVGMMYIANVPERLTRKLGSMDTMRNAGISGKMEYVLRRIIRRRVVENVRTRGIKN